MNVKRQLLFLTVLVLGSSCGTSGPAGPSSVAKTCNITTSSLVLNAGDTLRMNFAVPPTSGADVLQIDVSYFPNALIAGPSLSCQLFNGDRLLGNGPCVGNWQSSTTPARLPGVPLIDFSTIATGTSDGRVEFTVNGGSWLFDLKGDTVSIGRVITTVAGADVMFVAAGTISSFQLVSTSCR
jgi:hypothetical protein